MSHTSTLKSVVIRDTNALAEAVAFLQAQGINCSLETNAVPRMYYNNQHGECDYVLKLPNCPYDVGFAKQKDGTYLPVFDSYANHLRKVIGAPNSCPIPENQGDREALAITKLLNAYVLKASENELRSQGYYDFSYETQADGTIALIVEA